MSSLRSQFWLGCLGASAIGLSGLGACATGQASIEPNDERHAERTGLDPRGGKADRATSPTTLAEDGVDVQHTDLAIDLAAMQGRAQITLLNPSAREVAFEAGGLDVTAVRSGRRNLSHRMRDGALHVELPVQSAPQTITVEYGFRRRDNNDGYLAGGSTVLWPYFCGNVFPCRSNPRDGLTFSLGLTGVDPTKYVVFPDRIEAEAPAYMLAWAVGDYECQALGTTAAGTDVGVCWLPRGKTKALAGSRHLREVFEWYEANLGPYLFGHDVASVAVSWGQSGAGGMEHHPYWHIDVSSMDDEVTHAHEAVHGWFGDGVRIECWEDFVLSEGTVSYLSAVALGEVVSEELEAQTWRDYRVEMNYAIANDDTLAWPDSCGEVDMLKDGLFSNIVYMKGAFFYRAVEREIGRDALIAALSSFYLEHAGRAARMQDMIDHIANETGFDASALANAWLRSEGPAPR